MKEVERDKVRIELIHRDGEFILVRSRVWNTDGELILDKTQHMRYGPDGYRDKLDIYFYKEYEEKSRYQPRPSWIVRAIRRVRNRLFGPLVLRGFIPRGVNAEGEILNFEAIRDDTLITFYKDDLWPNGTAALLLPWLFSGLSTEVAAGIGVGFLLYVLFKLARFLFGKWRDRREVQRRFDELTDEEWERVGYEARAEAIKRRIKETPEYKQRFGNGR